MAFGGQTPSHARQNIQSGSFDINGFLSDAAFPENSTNSYTPTGHASMHAPSATQISKSTDTNYPHTPIIAFSVPTLPQVLIS